MNAKAIERISKELTKDKTTHLLLVKDRRGVTLSSIATGEDIYDFLQVLAGENPVILDIMHDVINSRRKSRKTRDITLN